MDRTVNLIRKTSETDIELFLALDKTKSDISCVLDTGIGFLDHMLALFAKHSGFELNIKTKGDTHVDCHHTIEDTGIVLGDAIKQALGDKKGIKRYGHAIIPMDEALVMVAVDLGGRPYFVIDAKFGGSRIGDMDTQMVEEFLRAVSFNGCFNMHVKVLYGNNDHHVTEAIFKAFAHALSDAVKISSEIDGVLSTKGII